MRGWQEHYYIRNQIDVQCLYAIFINVHHERLMTESYHAQGENDEFDLSWRTLLRGNKEQGQSPKDPPRH